MAVMASALAQTAGAGGSAVSKRALGLGIFVEGTVVAYVGGDARYPHDVRHRELQLSRLIPPGVRA